MSRIILAHRSNILNVIDVAAFMPARRFPPPWTVEGMTAERPMTAEQAATLKRLAEAAYELETFQLNLTAPRRICVSRC
jgi:hypothetical protein